MLAFSLVFSAQFLAASSDNWAVLIDSSKFYFNYRHTVNTLLVYQMLKKFNFEDDHILLMLPENHQCHPRNPFPGRIFDGSHPEDLMQDVEIDYRSAEVSPEFFTNLLIGRHPASFPNNKRLNSDKHSKVFIFMTGHGGNGYFKIQDTLVLKSADLAYAVSEMYEKGRFEELMIFIDSCQSLSMFDYIDLPGVHMLSSSQVGQPSKSYGTNNEIGLSTSDHFSLFFTNIFRGRTAASISKMSLENVIRQLPRSVIQSDIGVKSRQKNNELLIAEFITTNQRQIEKVETQTRAVEGKSWEYRSETGKEDRQHKIKQENSEWNIGGILIAAVGTIVFYITNVF
jgi:GPI-anchor transamidase subunit K